MRSGRQCLSLSVVYNKSVSSHYKSLESSFKIRKRKTHLYEVDDITTPIRSSAVSLLQTGASRATSRIVSRRGDTEFDS